MQQSASTQTEQMHSRGVIWIDHLQAKIFTMGLTGVTEHVVHAHLASPHLHHKANTIGSGRTGEDPAFLLQVEKVVSACTAVLLLGPGTEKTALLHYLQKTHPSMQLRVESCDHPSDAEIIALGRKHFGIAV
jgi:hypothetical protein